MTESPRKNILETNLSLLIGFPRVLPFPPFDVSVHISLTSSNNLRAKEVKKKKKEKNQCRFWMERRELTGNFSTYKLQCLSNALTLPNNL
jgi:hypothetical protein